MRRRGSIVAVLLFSLAAAAGTARSPAQNTVPVFDASALREPADLSTTWLIQAGDDPQYARADFDDSRWIRFDPHRSAKTVLKSAPAVIWYRLHVKTDPGQMGLALREVNTARAFEVYVNGQRVMVSGRVDPFAPATMQARLLTRIPDRMTATGALVIALRVHISQEEWKSGNAGYYAGNLTMGQWGTLYREGWLEIIGQNGLAWLDHGMEAGLGLVALVLYLAQRRERRYLWIAALGIFEAVEFIEPFAATFRNLPLSAEMASDLLRLASPFLWASLYFSFVGQRIGRRWMAFLIFAGLTNVFSALQGTFFTWPLPIQLIGNLPFIILLSVVIPIVLLVHWRRGNREAGILLIPALLFSIYIYAEVSFGSLFQFGLARETALKGLNLIDRFPAGPFAVSLDNISSIASTLALAIIMLLWSTTSIRRQALLESEFAAAQQVQEVLVPGNTGIVPGFKIESVYEPAQQVGGDFFQVLPVSGGGLLVVVGDVAGKGLPAAMLVSALVGSIRTAAEMTHAPAELLRMLNERLMGRTQGGFSTAVAAYISSDGRVSFANAGHLSPYHNGVEVELPGALPLGISQSVLYETIEMQLAPGGRLTFYSDGVIEAQNQGGELFGFERGQTISMRPAAEIVAAARTFGQQDDITVVSVEREPALADAA